MIAVQGTQSNTDPQQKTISGKIERVIFSRDGFTIFSLSNSDGDTIVQAHTPLTQNTRVACTGNYRVHPKHGRQFIADLVVEQIPADLEGLTDYLACAELPLIGPQTARAIVEAFGERTIEVLDTDPGMLSRVKNIGKKKIASIAKAWQERRAERTVMLLLQSHGVGQSAARKVLRRMGTDGATPDAIVAKIRDNPYCISDVSGIGFKTADAMALRLGLPTDSPERILAALGYALESESNRGHTRREIPILLKKTCELLCPDDRAKADAMLPLVEAIVSSKAKTLTHVVPVANPNGLALLRYDSAETRIATSIEHILKHAKPTIPPSHPLLVGPLFSEDGWEFTAEQSRAIRTACTNPATIVTGPPGTGKTAVLRKVVAILNEATAGRVCVCAPTGRAAKRTHTGMTMHMLLGLRGGGGYQADPLPQMHLARHVASDEWSMVDAELGAALLGALPKDCPITIVGDENQLPSVSAGHVLRDLIASGKIPVMRLTEIKRTDEGAAIALGCASIIGGRTPEFNGQDLIWIDAPSDAQGIRDDARTSRLVVRTLNRIIELGTTPDNIQILASMHRGPLGVEIINNLAQADLNPASIGKREIKIRDRILRAGDRVMQVRNDHENGQMNGDIGSIIDVDPTESTARVLFFEGRNGPFEVEVQPDGLHDLTLSYCSTIHKLQGHEYEAIILVLPISHYIMLDRNILYTAVSRAQKRCVIIGDRRALAVALGNTSAHDRETGLLGKLTKICQKGAK